MLKPSYYSATLIQNYSSDYNTWEPEAHFVEKKCIANYWSERQTKSNAGTSSAHTSSAVKSSLQKRPATSPAG